MTAAAEISTRGPSWVDATLWPWPAREHAGAEGVIRYLDVGEGPPVLFVHGTPTWSIDWRHLVAGLEQDHRCLAPDLLGFGQSDRPAGAGYRPEDHARRLAAFADSLDLDGLTVVLHDFGGPIALPWVLDNLSRVRRVVLLNTWAWPLDDPTTRLGARVLGTALGRWLYRWVNLSVRVIAPSAWGNRALLTEALYAQHVAPFEDREARVQVLWALARSLLGSEAHYAALHQRLSALREVEVDLIWGLKDTAFPAPYLERWRRELPHARVWSIEDAGHWPHEERPDLVLEALRSRE